VVIGALTIPKAVYGPWGDRAVFQSIGTSTATSTMPG
jgi:hypothetical protein